MLRFAGQAPVRWSSEMLDALSMLRSGYAPDGGGAGDGGGGGSGDSGAGAGAGEGGSGDGSTGSDGKPFDAERAQRTISALREKEKAGAQAAKERDDLAARLKAIEDKDKTDSEKLSGDLKSTTEKLSKAEQRAADLEAKYTRTLLSAAIEREAGKANAVDVETVAALVDRSGIAIDEAGNVTGADKAVAALLKAKPFLVNAGTSGGGVKTTPGTPSSAGGQSDAEIVAARAKEQREGRRFLGF